MHPPEPVLVLAGLAPAAFYRRDHSNRMLRHRTTPTVCARTSYVPINFARRPSPGAHTSCGRKKVIPFSSGVRVWIPRLWTRAFFAIEPAGRIGPLRGLCWHRISPEVIFRNIHRLLDLRGDQTEIRSERLTAEINLPEQCRLHVNIPHPEFWQSKLACGFMKTRMDIRKMHSMPQ